MMKIPQLSPFLIEISFNEEDFAAELAVYID